QYPEKPSSASRIFGSAGCVGPTGLVGWIGAVGLTVGGPAWPVDRAPVLLPIAALLATSLPVSGAPTPPPSMTRYLYAAPPPPRTIAQTTVVARNFFMA